MSDFLVQMMAAARQRAEEARQVRPLARPQPAAPHPHRLLGALEAAHEAGLAVIAEIKRASPSRGAIAPELDVVAQARAYEAAGADAVSVLTEPSRFAGSLADLEAVSAACTLPVLRKDFVVDAHQVFEAAAAGAAGVLLIAAGLDDASLTALLAECGACGLDALVEIHDEADLRRARAAAAPLVGINNRDLRTLAVDLAVTERLAPLVPPGVLLVSESGILSAAEARRVADAGARAVLVGEALLRAAQERLPDLIRDLRGRPPHAPRVKICGLTQEADVRLAVSLGAWACGFVLSQSPRRVAPHRAAELAALARPALTVGVVTTEPPDWIAEAVGTAGLDAVQLSAGADGPTVGAMREAARRRGLRPLVIAAADTPDAAVADFILLDAHAPGAYGGSGRSADWSAAALRSDRDRLVLAGGLRPSNVAAAIELVRPLAVDVASGVEEAPGLKGARLMHGFFAAIARVSDDHRGSFMSTAAVEAQR